MAEFGQDDDKTVISDSGQDDDKTIIASRPTGDHDQATSATGATRETPQQSDDRTLIATPSQQAQSEAKKRSPWLWIVAGVVVIFLCVAAIAVGAVFLLNNRTSTSGLLPGKTTEPKPVPTETVEATEPSEAPTPTDEEDTVSPSPTVTLEKPTVTKEPTPTKRQPSDDELSTPSTEMETTPASDTRPKTPVPGLTLPATDSKAQISTITFATGLDDSGQPIGAGKTFETDIEEIHAVFDYSGMVDGTPWERHWYLNDKEVVGGVDTWDAGSSGTYRLSLNSGGQPFDAGDWTLEIYVDGRLMQTGDFTVEGGRPVAPTLRLTSEATPPATLPEEEPTSLPVVPQAQKTYQLAFSRWDGGKHDLYIADTNGDNEQFILERAAGPSWSPDGRYLAFFGEEGVDHQRDKDGVEWDLPGLSNGIIYLDIANWNGDFSSAMINEDLGQFIGDGSCRWAAWSPDGSMVAYDAARGSPERRIYFLGTDDNQQFNIEIPGEQGGWSPDSNKIVYRSGRDNRQGIWMSNRDDSGAVNVTNDGSDSFPRWSPDGRKIAFHRESEGNVDIYLMNVDGSNIRRLTDAPGPDTLPTWTPDGRIVFRSARTGTWGIYIMNADSSNQELILPNADPGPDWSFGRMDVH